MAYQTKFDGNFDKVFALGVDGNPSTIEGYFLGSKVISTDYGKNKIHGFQTPTGTVGIFGKARLNHLLTEDLRGQKCLVEFTGMIEPKKKGQMPAYGFKVLHDPDDIIDVSPIGFEDKKIVDGGETQEDIDENERRTYQMGPSYSSSEEKEKFCSSDRNRAYKSMNRGGGGGAAANDKPFISAAAAANRDQIKRKIVK